MTETNDTTTAPHDESEIYDRQIRLWGAEAQMKISKAQVLYIHLTGVSTEVLKNLVLAGVRPVLCDARSYPQADTPTFFRPSNKKMKYASVAHAMQGKVEELNPLLGECKILNKAVSELSAEELKDFDMIIASQVGMADAARIAKASASSSKFYLVDCFGWNGAAVVDLGPNHTYRMEEGKNKLSDEKQVESYLSVEEIWKTPLGKVKSAGRRAKTPEPVWLHYRAILEYHAQTGSWPTADKAEDFVQVVQEWIGKQDDTLKELPCLSQESLKQLAATATAQVSPVCAVLGGVIGNEVIKAISGKGEPANNVLFFDAWAGKCRTVFVKND